MCMPDIPDIPDIPDPTTTDDRVAGDDARGACPSYVFLLRENILQNREKLYKWERTRK